MKLILSKTERKYIEGRGISKTKIKDALQYALKEADNAFTDFINE